MEFCWEASPVADSTTRPQKTSRRQKIRGSTNTLSAANAHEYFCYLDCYNVLICREHATGIQNLSSHLRDYHVVPAKERKAIVKQFEWATIEKADQVRLPSPMGPPIKELGKPLSGFQCNEVDCNYISVNQGVFQTHCKRQHKLRWVGNTSELYTNVKVQSFFRAGGQQRYFVVHAPDGSEPKVPRNVQTEVDALLADWKVTSQVEEAKMQVMDAEAAKTDKTGWFKRTGWLEHLAKRNRAHLVHQIRLPDRTEVKLQQAAKLVELLVERSVAGLATLAQETRRWLKSTQQHDPHQQPLGRLQNPESQAGYARYMVKFVCYLLRIIADEEVRIAQMRRSKDYDSNNNVSTTNSSTATSSDSGSHSGANRLRRRRQRAVREKIDMMKDARELFPWYGSQKQLAIELWQTLGDGGNKDMQLEALLDVLAAFIFQNHKGRVFDCGLIHFLAVLGIDPDMDRLREGYRFSYVLAGVVYCVRVLGLEKLLPAARRDEQTDEDLEQFLEKRKKFLADGSYSPMSEMINLLALGKHISYQRGNAGSAYWSRDKKTYYLNGRPIAISRFRTMAQELVAKAEQMLWQELLWIGEARDQFKIKLERIVDDVTFTQRGKSFISQGDNGLEGGLQWMLAHVLQSQEGSNLYLRDGSWNVKRVKRYLRQVDRFLELLLISVHITSGQPGRGSEVTTMRHRNGVLQDRNIFVVDGQVMTVVRYHKSQSQWDKPRVVPRFLPPRLGQVIVLYLAYLQPFYEYLNVEVLGGSFSDYVWADGHGPWKTDRLTRVLERETGKRLGVTLHTRDYRHTAVGIGRVKVGESFGRGYQDEVGEVEEAEVEEAGESALELQNARTTVTGVGTYSVPIDIVKNLSIRSVETFRPLSMLWHRFLGLGGGEEMDEEAPWASSEVVDRTKKKRGRDDASGNIENTLALRRRAFQPQEDSRKERLQAAMRQVLSQSREASFKSVEQELATNAVLDGQTPLVVVLPTGGGKSLVFMVPACMESSGTTIVVVPYRALINELVERVRSRGIDCMEWKHGESNPATIVVVSADVAGETMTRGNFLSYAGMLANKGLLRRVVVDECHLVFTSSDWRPKLGLLKNLRLLSCPIVLLTATLPPVREGELAESMGVWCATYIRASTVRPNTCYYVSWCAAGEAQETALAICQRQQQRLKGRRQRGIVYCNSKTGCEALAEALQCAYYHAEAVERGEWLKEWLRVGGLIIATSALGTGLDFLGVVFILHVGMPWSIIDFAQESGRGGRGGERVDSMVLVEHGEVERRVQQKSEDMDVQAMGFFIIGSGCRRGLMSGYLDKKRVNCNDIESAGCDRCGEGASGWQEEQVETSSSWQQVREVMDELRDGCAVCWVMGDLQRRVGEGYWQEHKVMQCKAYLGLQGGELDIFRRGIQDIGSSHSCRRCWVSQVFCATGEDVGNKCQWPNVVVPLAKAATGLVEGLEIIRECGFQGELGGEWKEYARWLGKRHTRRVWGRFFSNVIVVAIRVILYISGYNSGRIEDSRI